MNVTSCLRILCLTALLAVPAAARSPIAEIICEPTARMHDKLLRQFGAQRAATGVRGPEQIMEVWTSGSGSWTMVVTYATGTSCIVAMGEDWYTHFPDGPARG